VIVCNHQPFSATSSCAECDRQTAIHRAAFARACDAVPPCPHHLPLDALILRCAVCSAHASRIADAYVRDGAA
jgi:hypothetical protein